MTELTKVLTASDKASKTMASAATNLKKTFEGLDSFVESVRFLTDQIEEKQSDLNALNQQTEDAVRRAKAEMDLRILEDRKGTMLALMEEFGMAEINRAHLDTLVNDLEEAQNVDAEHIEREIQIAESKLHAQYKGQIATLEANHRVAVAEKDATITAKTQEIGFLQRNITTLEATISEERKARIEIANAESQRQGVVVNTTSK